MADESSDDNSSVDLSIESIHLQQKLVQKLVKQFGKMNRK